MYSNQLIYITFKTQNNPINKTVKPYDPLLLKTLESFREIMLGEFYRNLVGNTEWILVVKVKNEEETYQDVNDELDWKIVEKIVKNGQTSLQFQVKCKLVKKFYKKQMKETNQRLKEIEFESQILELKKKLIENTVNNTRMEKPQDPRDELLESIKAGQTILRETPKTTKVITDPREIMLNSIRSRQQL